MTSPAKIFISYRRQDTAGYAYTVFDQLCRCFDPEVVFYDQDDRHHLPSGSDWEARIFAAIDSASACLVVIGPNWLEINDESGQPRLHRSDDIVRQEVAKALAKAANGAMTIFPVLFGKAEMPAREALPANLQNLLHHQSRPYCLDSDAGQAFARLIDALAACPNMPAARPYAGPQHIFHLIDHPLSQHFSDPQNRLAQLRALLEERSSAAVLAATTVQGMGGVGKTQLALKYSHSYRNEYHGVWWFRAESKALLDDDCAAFCATLQIPVPQGTPHHQALRDWLARQARWLLVYDNVENATEVQAYLPQGSRHHILITSRLAKWDGPEPLRLDVWNDEESLEFLRSRQGKVDDPQGRSLAHALGGLPLALEQACAYLVKTNARIDDYIACINDYQRQHKMLDRKDSSQCPSSVLATLSLAFDHLSLPARQLLHLCAWLAPEAIPEYLFTENTKHLPMELAAQVGQPLDWRETVAELTGYALCQISDDQTAGPALLFHRLTQAAIQVQQGIQDEQKIDLRLLRTAFPKDSAHPKNWPRCATLLPHVLHFANAHERGVVLNADYLSWLLDHLGSYLRLARGHYSVALRLQRKALAIRREYDGEEHPNTLSSINNLAITLKAQGDLAGARELHESVFVARCRLLGKEHSDTLSSMNNLASILKAQGKVSDARKLQKSVLTARQRLLGKEHPKTLISMNNRASTLKAEGDLAGARKLHKSVLAARRRLLGEEHPDTLTSMNNLASTLKAQGNLASARQLYEFALAGRSRMLGDNHPHTQASRKNLVATLKALEDAEAAQRLLNEADRNPP